MNVQQQEGKHPKDDNKGTSEKKSWTKEKEEKKLTV